MNSLNKELEQFIEELYQNQNSNVVEEQKDLFTRQDYYQLLRPVVEIIANNPDCTIEELRSKLYEQSDLEKRVKSFVFEKEMVPGMVFSYGTDKFKETIVIGNRQEVALDNNGNLIPSIEIMTEDTIFDIASVTKIFTSLSILKLVEMGIINLDDKITKYSPQFKNLSDVSIFDLLSFRKTLKTNSAIAAAPNYEEAERILFDTFVDKDFAGENAYSDIGAMVLKYVIEGATGNKYYEFIDKYIIQPLGLTDTYSNVPKWKTGRVASTNFDGKYYKDGTFEITTYATKGIVYDPKARILRGNDKELSGHAGLFTTQSDMTKVAKGMIDGQIIDEKYIMEMAKNRTGRVFSEDEKGKTYAQYLGYLCYSKNPILVDSEVFHALAGRTIGSGGWTGTQLTVDPVNNIFFTLLANRSHNRMTFINQIHEDKIIKNAYGRKTILLPNGEEKIVATRYAWDRDTEVVHPAIKLAIQYKMLDRVYSFEKDQHLTSERTRQL